MRLTPGSVALALSVGAHAALFLASGTGASANPAAQALRVRLSASPAAVATPPRSVPKRPAPPPPSETPKPAPARENSALAEAVAAEAPVAAESATSQGVIDIFPALDRFRRRIESLKRYPSAAMRRGIEGTVIILATLDESGRLVESVIMRSSGAPVLDAAALALIERATPFRHHVGRRITLEIPIAYQIDEEP